MSDRYVFDWELSKFCGNETWSLWRKPYSTAAAEITKKWNNSGGIFQYEMRIYTNLRHYDHGNRGMIWIENLQAAFKKLGKEEYLEMLDKMLVLI